MSRKRQRNLALLIILMVGSIWPTHSPARSSFNPHQVGLYQQPDFKPKCPPLGFVVYERWEKPVGLFPFYQDCKLGYVDTQGRVVISPQFDRAGFFHEGLAVVGVNINGKLKYGFINQTGRFVIDPEFDSAGNFSDGLAGIRLDRNSGYIDRKGQVVISPQFAEVFPFYRGLARVRIFSSERDFRGKWGCINKRGEFVVPPNYDHIQHFTEPVVVAGIFTNKQWKYGLISWTGKLIVEPQFESIGNFENGVAPVRFERKGKIIDSMGQMIPSVAYNQTITNFSEGLIAVSINGHSGYLNRKGELVIAPTFLSAGQFSEGVAPVKVGREFGYIDKTGKLVISPRFEEATEFSEGLARVKIEGKYGFIDKEGVVKISPQFSSVTSFRGGAALARMGNDVGYINRTGRFIRRWPDSIAPLLEHNTFRVQATQAKRSRRLR
jgi:hypothetical protein